jgi:hypothetical protein
MENNKLRRLVKELGRLEPTLEREERFSPPRRP